MGFLAELKKLVYDQTQKLGVAVGNIYGAAQTPLEKLGGVEQSSWLVLTIPSRSVTSIDNFYALYSSLNTAAVRTLDSITGAVVFQYPGSDAVTTLIRGTVELVQARSFNLAVQTEDTADYLVQIDDHVVRQGTGGRELGLYLDPGTHVIEVLAAANVLGVQVPADLRISANFERVATPTWAAVTTGYVDAVQGPATVALSWYVDAKAGGWRVLRRQLITVSAILAVDAIDTNSEFTIKVTGNQTGLLTGQELFAAHELIGVVLSTRLGGSDTFVRLRLPPGRLAPSNYWAGQLAMTGTFIEIQRIGRTQAAGQMTWNDNNVEAGQLYDYALQAWGFLGANNAWSAVSAIRSVCAGDATAPGSIVFVSGYPQVVDRRAFAQFTTPSDTDYAGVRVYYRQKFTGTATGGTASTIVTATDLGTLSSAWTIRITAGTGTGQERTWVSHAGTSVSITPDWVTTPNGTSQYLIFKDTVIVTDFGIPEALDQFNFEPISTDPAGPVQEYQFRTFDTAFNEQGGSGAINGAGTVSCTVGAATFSTSQVGVVANGYVITVAGVQYAVSAFNGTTTCTLTGTPTFSASTFTVADSAYWIFDPGSASESGWTSPPVIGIRQVPAVNVGALLGQNSFTGPFAWLSPTTGYDNITNYAIVELSASDVAGRRGAVTISYQRRDDSSPITLPASANPVTQGTAPANLDNPAGTRSRYIAIQRTTKENWVKVFATDSDGNISDTITYTVDYNNQPEIASFEARVDPVTAFTADWNTGGINPYGSGTVNVAGMVRVAGAVDDDSRALKYWVEDPTGTDPTIGAPRTLDMSTNRSFTFITSLGDGQKKGLVLEPWSGFAGGVATGVAGTQVQRDFSRAPRAQVHFEDKDTNGDVSGKWVTAYFDILPIPAVQTPVTVGSVLVAHASASTSTTLKASGSPGWTVNQWSTQSPRKFFVIVMNSSGVCQIAGIISNTADTLTISPPWTTIPHGYKYWVVDSAVMQRLDESGNYLPSGGMVLDASVTPNVYAPSSGKVYFERKTGNAVTLVEYYGAKNNCPDESPHKVAVDADTIPEFAGTPPLTLVEVSANNLRVTAVEPDDDVKVWRAYRRKGAWPTFTGSLPSPFTAADLDRQYLHHTDTVNKLTYDSYAGTGQQYVVIVPTNSMNQDGPPVSGTVAVSGALGNPQLTNLRTTHDDVFPAAYNRIIWDHPNIADASTAYHVKVFAYRKITASGVTDVSSAELTPGGFVRLATYDSETSDSHLNTDDTSTTFTGRGSWIHALPADRNTRSTEFGGVAYTWVYTVSLYDGSNALVGTYAVEDTDYYVPTPCEVTACDAFLTDSGTDDGLNCITQPTRVITWSTSGTNDDAYTVAIRVQVNGGAVTYVALGLLPSAGTWTHYDSGYSGGGATPRDWLYSALTVRISDGAGGALATASLLSDMIKTCRAIHG